MTVLHSKVACYPVTEYFSNVLNSVLENHAYSEIPLYAPLTVMISIVSDRKIAMRLNQERQEISFKRPNMEPLIVEF